MRSTAWVPLIMVCTIPVLLGANDEGCNPRTPVGEDLAECGDGVCDTSESADICPEDCTPDPVCGNGICDSGESIDSCPEDCPTDPICGNGICDTGESIDSCPEDCPTGPICGDGVCDTGESMDSCPDDCGSGEDCDNGVDDDLDGMIDCEDVDCASSSDCDPSCGDGVCDPDLETAESCPEDCVISEVCNNDVDDDLDGAIDCADADCADDPGCDPLCGDGICGATETAATCPEDCAVTEDCDNGMDDDMDGAVDCADSDCVGTSGCGECSSGDSVSCLCGDGRAGVMRCVDGHWTTCGECSTACGDGVCDAFETAGSCPADCVTAEDCDNGTDDDLDGAVDCADPDCASDPDCPGGSVCGDGVCAADEDVAGCPVDCMSGLPTESEACVDVSGEWLCAAGHICINVEGSRFCYLEGCSTAADCSESLIEDSQVASPDFSSGLRAQCMTEMGEGACIGYSPLFFVEEGSRCVDSIPMGPDRFCHQCGPLSVCLPDEYFDSDPWSPWPLDESEMRCRRHCTAHSDCASGQCLFIDDLSTDDYACVLVPTGYCCLPGDDAPGCS